jgi:CCR4-NOT transcriptional regulation complex NOT5 subunit
MKTLDQYKEGIKGELKAAKAIGKKIDPAEYHGRCAAAFSLGAWDLLRGDADLIPGLDAEQKLERAQWHIAEALKAIRKEG